MYTIYYKEDNEKVINAVKLITSLKANYIKKAIGTQNEENVLKNKLGVQMPKTYPIILIGDLLIGTIEELKLWVKDQKKKNKK